MNWQKTNRGCCMPFASSRWRFMRAVSIRRSRGIYLPGIVLCILLSPNSRCRAEYGMAVIPQSGQVTPGQAGNPPADNRAQNPRGQPPSRPHLAEWLQQHRNMSPQQQERALRNEPGFNRLPQPQQQKLLGRLRQLDAMPPVRRERTLQRMEALERLSPQQREQVRSAMQEAVQLSPQRKGPMHRAFRDLSQMPTQQREAVLDSAQFKAQFSDRERQMLKTLLSVQPYPPVNRRSVKSGGK